MAPTEETPKLEPDQSPLTSVDARRARMFGSLIGVVLLAAAVTAIVMQRDALTGALDSLRAASPALLLLALIAPIVNVALASVTFWILTTRYGHVGKGEMFALIGSAWLLNYLPFWPGMIGRLAYHKNVNQIAVRDSAKVIIWANVLNLIAAITLVVLVALGSLFFAGDHLGLAMLLVAPAPLLLVIGAYAWSQRPEPDPEVWRIIIALAIRIVELHVHAVRSYVCFTLVGVPIGWGGALAIASVSGLAGAVNIAPNGLGVREWVVGIAAPIVPAGLTLRSDLRITQGLSADLINRAAEVLVAVPVGLACAAWLSRRVRRARTSADMR